MDDGPDIVNETTRAALPLAERRDGWLEQRLSYLAGEQARLKGGVPLRRFLWGAMTAYRRFLLTADPAHRFHCWATIQAVSAGLDQLERKGGGHKVPGSAPDGPDPGQALAAGLTDRPP
jgi:hypothetical protein